MIDTILTGDAHSMLRTIQSESVQCVVTSPPYFNLRNYRTHGQIGQEKSVVAYTHRLVSVFEEVRRVLTPDGLLFLTLGDSYLGKQLMGVPWRVAFALQSQGWILRNDVVWHKPNPMPLSVRDRFTNCHEFVFMFAKNERYYFDQDAVREPMKPESAGRYRYAFGGKKNRELQATDNPTAIVGNRTPTDGRNRRDVWTINNKHFKGAHFAVFPDELAEVCIKSGSRLGDVVLDPFMGAGTTALVAKQLGRHYLGIELNPEYVEMAKRRVGEPDGSTTEAVA